MLSGSDKTGVRARCRAAAKSTIGSSLSQRRRKKNVFRARVFKTIERSKPLHPLRRAGAAVRFPDQSVDNILSLENTERERHGGLFLNRPEHLKARKEIQARRASKRPRALRMGRAR